MQYVRDGMVIGLGTGSTAKFFIQAVGSALRTGSLRNVRGVPTSVYSERLARIGAASRHFLANSKD